MEVPKTVYEYVKNDSGVTLLKGTPVHSTGTVGFNSLVIASSASNAATMPATYILAQDLDDEEEGLGIAMGAILGVNTTGLTAGKSVYVGANGGWTQTKPTGSNLIQSLGIVTKVGVNGGGVVLGAGRANDVPNIQQGHIWVGNSGSVATATPTSSFELSGRGVISGSNQLPQIAGLQEYTASLKGAIEVSGQNVNVLGMITAQQFNVTYVSSSVMYQSGSTKFGNSVDDKHEFTGSVDVNGSGMFSGTLSAQSNIDLTGDLRYQSNSGFGIKSQNGNRLIEIYNGLSMFSGSLALGGVNLSSTYASRLGLYNVGAPANMELGTGTNTNGNIISRLTSYNINNGNTGNQGSTNFIGIASVETQLVTADSNATNTSGGNILFKTKRDGGILDNTLTLASTGDVTVSNGNLIMGTSGKGIDFSATSNGSGTTNSELLNDYEEGTFTATVEGTSTAGTATYTDRSASYTKIGKCVFFRIDVIWSGHTGTGSIKITGLPFTIGQNYMTSITTRFDQTTTANNYLGGGFIYATQVEPQLMPVGGGATSGVPITAAGDMRIAGHYFV
jgi:hypothetical protein